MTMRQRNPWHWGHSADEKPTAKPVEPDPVEPDPVEPDPVEPDPVEPEQPADPAPWHSMTKHADLDQYMDDQQITEPDGWDSMTIADKKAWLDTYAQ
jgi:hypothetical protein